MAELYESLQGNQNGVKLKDPDIRQRAYEAYLAWLARGKSKKSFTFVEGEYMCHYLTIESYMKTEPTEFDPKKAAVAYSQGYAHWENICDGSADGSNRKAQTASLNMVMRNKFKWDQEKEKPSINESMSDLLQYAKALKEQRVQPEAPPADHSD